MLLACAQWRNHSGRRLKDGHFYVNALFAEVAFFISNENWRVADSAESADAHFSTRLRMRTQNHESSKTGNKRNSDVAHSVAHICPPVGYWDPRPSEPAVTEP